jgi:proline dehydrogenase
MEASNYVEPTLAIYRRILADHPNAGICLQAYLHRTGTDIDGLLPLKSSIRLVKGAYAEPCNVALKNKSEIDQNYLALTEAMLQAQSGGAIRRVAFATHDPQIIHWITNFAEGQNIPRVQVEFQMSNNASPPMDGAPECSSHTVNTGIPGSCGVLPNAPPIFGSYCATF